MIAWSVVAVVSTVAFGFLLVVQLVTWLGSSFFIVPLGVVVGGYFDRRPTLVGDPWHVGWPQGAEQVGTAREDVAANTDIWLAGSRLQSSRHVCAFFRTSDERYRVLLPFIKEGIDRHERAFHIVDPALRQDHLDRLQAIGIDTAAAETGHQLEVRVWEDAYLRGGHFDQDAMLALIQEVLEAGTAQGFPLTRLVAQMEWALEDRPGVNDLVEYETRLNYILPRYRDPVI